MATVNNLAELMKDALNQAKGLNLDVFNALNVLDNSLFLDELKFMPGDGYLHFYLYNWDIVKRLSPGDIGVVLV